MVKKHTGKILFLTILSLLFLNCSHTNELAKFNLVNKTVLFKYYSNSDLARVNVSIDDKYLYKDDPFTVILTDIGESYAESDKDVGGLFSSGCDDGYGYSVLRSGSREETWQRSG